MALAKGTKALLAMLAVGYVIFLAVFFYQSFVKHGLVSVPVLEINDKLPLPDSSDEETLKKFSQNYVEIEVIPGKGNTGRYRIKELRPSDLSKRIKNGEKEMRGVAKSQATAADSFAKSRFLTAAPIKVDNIIVLPKAVELGLKQIELLTKKGIAGKEDIPVQGHGQIIGINATMGFVILNFLVLVALLYGLLWNPITGMLDERAGSIRKDIEQAAASREDAEKLKMRYEQALANARSEANHLKQEKVREGDAEKDKIITHAREEARRLADDANTQIETAVADSKLALRREIGGISVDIAAKILTKEIDKNIHQQLIDDFLRNLETEKI